MRQNEQQNAAHEPHRIQRELEMTLAVILKFRLGGQGKLYVSSSFDRVEVCAIPPRPTGTVA